jgi:hypothetical protein
MKTLLNFRIVMAFLMALLVFSCKKDEVVTPPCQLSGIDRGNNNVHTYTYDANSKITTMSREFDGNGSGKIDKYVYTFTYDAAGLLTKSAIKLEGKDFGTETYTYTSGKISKVTFAYTDGTKGVNNIKYNASGQLIEFTFETGDPDYDGKQYFEYDANSIMTKRGFADLKGNKLFEVVLKPVGVVKSPEALLASAGLPYDVLTGFQWQVAEGGVGTTSEVFYDDNGKLVSDGVGKITDSKTNSQGYLTENTYTDATTKNTQRFTITGCN